MTQVAPSQQRHRRVGSCPQYLCIRTVKEQEFAVFGLSKESWCQDFTFQSSFRIRPQPEQKKSLLSCIPLSATATSCVFYPFSEHDNTITIKIFIEWTESRLWAMLKSSKRRSTFTFMWRFEFNGKWQCILFASSWMLAAHVKDCDWKNVELNSPTVQNT